MINIWNIFNIFRNSDSENVERIGSDYDKFLLMIELQYAIEEGIKSFEEVKAELEEQTKDTIYKVRDKSGKIVKVSIMGGKSDSPYMAIGVMTYEGYIFSGCIEGLKIKDFDIEKDDISSIEGRKVSILEINGDCIIDIKPKEI
jgi:hypothetical protein